MSILYSYPTVTPESSDLLIGTEITGAGEDAPRTRTFTIGSIVDLAITNLSVSRTSSSATVLSDTGTDAVIPVGDGTLAGVSLNNYSSSEKAKLAALPDASMNQKFVLKDAVGNGGGGSTSEVVVRSLTIPANSFVTGDFIKLDLSFGKIGSNLGGGVAVYINSINSLSGATKIADYPFASDFLRANFKRDWFLNGSLLEGFYTGTTNFDSDRPVLSSVPLPSTFAYSPSADRFIIITIQLFSTADNWFYRGLTLRN